MEINKNGLIYHFKKDDHEIDDMFYERCWKAVAKKPKTEKQLETAIKNSKLWVYKKYYLQH